MSLFLVFLLLAACIRATQAGNSDSCTLHTAKGVGYTAGGIFFDKKTVKSADECCAWCNSNTTCGVFTFHPKDGICTIAKTAHINQHVSSGTVSGSKSKVPPAPPGPKPPPKPAACPQTKNVTAKEGSPNIVLFLTDDMDKLLGGWTPMKKTTKLLSNQGATAKNWFIHTPVCCPSRAELLTGRYFHNIRVPNTSEHGCMYVDVKADADSAFYKDWYFGPHMEEAGYTVGIFGKHLNNDNPKCPPPGVSKWFANGGGAYYNPSFSVASAGDASPQSATFNNCSYGNNGACYSTSVIGNHSIAWMRQVLAQPKPKPFFAYVAVKAPHIQDGPGWPITLPAPWYNHSDIFPNLRAPRTPNWNASCPDHHWLIRQQPPMTQEQAFRSDALYRARWLSLLSVDDLVEETVTALEDLGALNNTYLLFTSDHGFRFGQYRMPEGKWNAYDNDLRIPMVIRGPGIRPNTTFDWPASNVDTMPTVLGLAGVPTPASMDGRSIAHLVVQDLARAPAPTRALLQATEAPEWRSEQLVEYNGLGNVVRYEHLEDTHNNTFRALRIVNGSDNLKYTEFTSTGNWDWRKPADEFELFDLSEDPWELKNLYSSASASRRELLHDTVDRLFRCRGTTCN